MSGPGKTSVDKTSAKGTFEPNAFIRINPDNTVDVIIKHLEMGQGTFTGLSTLVAEELDADWSQIKPQPAAANAALYNNLLWGPVQGTGGSSAIANSFEQMRNAGAAAKMMLIAAAAESWKVSKDEITVNKGILTHKGTGKSASFGDLAELAAKQEVPEAENIKLKDPKDFVLIGKHVPRKDSGKTDGTAIFTQDIKLDGMLTALVAHSPRFGGKVKTFNAEQARKNPGVVDVVQIPTGVAVLAKDFWSAKKARDVLDITWDNSKATSASSEGLILDYKALAEKPGLPAKKSGDTDTAFKNAAKIIEASYEFPFLAHAAMEPLNCVIQFKGDSCEMWYGAQIHTMDQGGVAAVLGIKPDAVKINTLYAGGSFGRRGNPKSDYVLEAAEIAKAKKGIPVKLIPGIPIQWWRAVGSTHTAYSTETFIDEIAEATKTDPVDFRMQLLTDNPRHQGVLKLATEKAGWSNKSPEGRTRGVAVHESFNSYVAEVAEVSVQEDGKYKVERVVCAVDCGIAVNPDIVKAQMEGGIGFGLSPTLVSEITVGNGSVKESNFHDYQVLRMNQMPDVEVHIVPSAKAPTGVGEPGTPVIAPAVANALFASTDDTQWVLGTIYKTEGSCYRKAGAMMLFSGTGQQYGLLSGGCLESGIQQQAKRVMSENKAMTICYDASDEDDLSFQLGIGCGGIVYILLQPVSAENNYLELVQLHDAMSRREDGFYHQLVDEEAGEIKASFTLDKYEAEKNQYSPETLDIDHDQKISQKTRLIDDQESDGRKQWLITKVQAEPHILVIGGGLDASPVINIAKELGWETTLWDPRPANARPEYFMKADHILNCESQKLSDYANEHRVDAAILMTHNVKLDAEALKILQDTSIQYMALLGPVSRRQKVLKAVKLTEGCLKIPLSGPAGLDVGGELPESIALSIISECHERLMRRERAILSIDDNNESSKNAEVAA
ncbi:Isoquinoline 1-oxidoreductase subunit beta [Nymphon striatum]|nr:Isoquinoline 1-oxidoreductase subunit beta [Nymphon striatum]